MLACNLWLPGSLLVISTLLCFARPGSTTSVIDSPKPSQHTLQSLPTLKAEGSCAPLENMLVQGKNWTAEEMQVLRETICWRNDLKKPSLRTNILDHRGIPDGVHCNQTEWCDQTGICTQVCARGSVEISPWLANALKTQLVQARYIPSYYDLAVGDSHGKLAITRKLSFCNATLPGTHNSAITLADGYGNLDAQFQQYFAWIRWVADDATLRTNDHYFSLTDQLNMGVRSVELDTHQVEGALRIAHCGGYHGDVDLLIDAVNIVAKLFGHPIHWDSETIGCNPSLSSIPVTEQRTFASALKEISTWLSMSGNEDEFLVLYLDDQRDLLDWGDLPELFVEILAYFPIQTIFTPLELKTLYKDTWPSIDELSSKGKSVLFVTGYDYGPVIDTLMFSKEGRKTVCGWTEPDFSLFESEPECLANSNPYTGQTLSGRLFRIITCELYYGPMNCNFVWSSSNSPLLDEESLPRVSRCGLNMPSPDLLTPKRAASTIWSWAPGHPYPEHSKREQTSSLSLAILDSLRTSWRSWLASKSECATISKQDGRWRVASCNRDIPTACWHEAGNWTLQTGARGTCLAGATFSLPEQAKANSALQRLLQSSNIDAAWLPLEGPDWAVTGSPLYHNEEVVDI